jgi:hypothetical protein
MYSQDPFVSPAIPIGKREFLGAGAVTVEGKY